MATKTIRRKRHSVYSLRYHFVWIPKYRKSFLKGQIKTRLEKILREVATENKWGVLGA